MNTQSGQDSAGSGSAVYILIGIAAFLGIAFAVIFNKLVKARNMLREAWSGIDVQLKRRNDLVPNIVETVKGYGKHEKEIFENAANSRYQSSSDSPKDRASVENGLTQSIKQLFAVAESYPDLKADKSFLELQKNLVEIEDNIQMARRYYNGTARDYNVAVESFPSNVFAALFGFKPAEFFEIELATQREAPEVKMGG